jgi:hypothetical protein
MTNGWKRKSQYYSALILLALSIVGVITVRLSVTSAFACDGTLVVVDGQVTCQISGNNPGGNDGTSGGTEDTGTPGQSGGGGNNGGNKNNKNDDGIGNNGACTPGTAGEVHLNVPPGSLNLPNESISYTLPDGSTVTGDNAPAGMCTTVSQWVDTCTGEAMAGPSGPIANSAGVFALTQCPTSYNTPPNPCDKFAVNSSGVTCTTDFVDSDSFPGSKWQLTVTAPWPGAEIHTRPYPVTLVNWDTVMRVAGLGSSSKARHLSYAAWGGGTEGDPSSGDWKDITLRLEIKPVASWADVFLENIGLIRMRIGELHTFQWNLPSHPAAGGGPLSGQVGQLEELEPDVPLFTNWTRAPYLVYCTISYYEWQSTCVNGPDENGGTNCKKNSAGVYTGHREWGWKRHSQTVAVTPDMLKEPAPASALADLNNDGKPDAYWGRLSFIRRMDDAGRVDNPEWAHSYSWGPVWYWGVREGQGQIGWPGVAVP